MAAIAGDSVEERSVQIDVINQRSIAQVIAFYSAAIANPEFTAEYFNAVRSAYIGGEKCWSISRYNLLNAFGASIAGY